MQNKAEGNGTGPLWDLDDLTDFLKVSKRTARRRIKEDGLPFRRIGGEYRFVPDEVRAWVDRQPGWKPETTGGM